MASASVVSIAGVPIWTGEADRGLVSVLEDVLERARSGEVVGVVFAAQYRDNSAYHAAAGAYTPANMIGRLTMAAHAIARDAT